MHTVNVIEAKEHLAELIEEAANGEDVVIVQDNGSTFKIVPMSSDKPYPKFGSARGLVKMTDDFDEPLKGFEEYAP